MVNDPSPFPIRALRDPGSTPPQNYLVEHIYSAVPKKRLQEPIDIRAEHIKKIISYLKFISGPIKLTNISFL